MRIKIVHYAEDLAFLRRIYAYYFLSRAIDSEDRANFLRKRANYFGELAYPLDERAYLLKE